MYGINNLNEKIEYLTKDNKEKEITRGKMQDDHQKDLKDINTKHLAEVENKKQEIAALDENYEDITNWLLIEADKEFERQTLQNTFNGIIHKHQQEMDNIKRERGIAIDKLRKEML